MWSEGDSAAALHQQVIDLLEAHDVTATAQRVEVAEVLFARPQHLSADQILETLRAAGSGVSKATVYNTLNLFSDKGLIRAVSVDATRQFYDPTTEPHHHFYNVDTGELTDIPPESVAFDRLPDVPDGTTRDSVDVVIRIRSDRR